MSSVVRTKLRDFKVSIFFGHAIGMASHCGIWYVKFAADS